MQTDETTVAEPETIAPPPEMSDRVDEPIEGVHETTGDGTGEPVPPLDGQTGSEAEGGTFAAGGGSGMAIEMARQAFAENLTRAEEGVLSYGFDLERAWREIEGIASSLAEKKSAWDSAKAEAAECKKDYDLEVETLRKRIDALSTERKKPALPLTGAEALTSGKPAAGCSYEARTGQRCPVCRSEAPPDDDAPSADTSAHDEAATEAAAKAFGQQLEEAEVFLDVAEIIALDLSAKATLDQWLNERAVIAAAQAGDAEVQHLPFLDVFARKAHLAGEPDTETGNGQACTKCGRQLLDDVDIADDGTYPVGAHVGLDCEGAHEIARPPKKRGRTKKNRSAPEAERADQIAAANTVIDEGDEAE